MFNKFVFLPDMKQLPMIQLISSLQQGEKESFIKGIFLSQVQDFQAL